MSKSRRNKSFTPHRDFIVLALLILIAGLIVFMFPPTSVFIIALVVILAIVSLYLALYRFVKTKPAFILSVSIGIFAMMKSLELLDIMNIVIAIATIITLTVLLYQK